MQVWAPTLVASRTARPRLVKRDAPHKIFARRKQCATSFSVPNGVFKNGLRFCAWLSGCCAGPSRR